MPIEALYMLQVIFCELGPVLWYPMLHVQLATELMVLITEVHTPLESAIEEFEQYEFIAVKINLMSINFLRNLMYVKIIYVHIHMDFVFILKFTKFCTHLYLVITCASLSFVLKNLNNPLDYRDNQKN